LYDAVTGSPTWNYPGSYNTYKWTYVAPYVPPPPVVVYVPPACTTSTITASVTIDTEQTAMAGSADMKFKIPIYTNSRSTSECDAVQKAWILSTGCSTSSTGIFSNAVDITGTAAGGFWYALLIDGSSAATHNFCLRIRSGSSGSIILNVDNLKMVIFECTDATIAS